MLPLPSTVKVNRRYWGRPQYVTSYNGGTAPQPWNNNTASTGIVTTSYTSDNQLITDQAGVMRTLQTDGLGRLQTVTEAGATVTSYSYDALDDLTSVAQAGLSNRSFTYDSLGRLGSAFNPESGTTTYHYDANGNLTSKADARSITTTFRPDLFGRVTKKTYSDGTPTVYYCYDGQTWSVSACAGTAAAPSINRLTQVTSSASQVPGPHEIVHLAWSTVGAAFHDLLFSYCRPYRRRCMLKRLRSSAVLDRRRDPSTL